MTNSHKFKTFHLYYGNMVIACLILDRNYNSPRTGQSSRTQTKLREVIKISLRMISTKFLLVIKMLYKTKNGRQQVLNTALRPHPTSNMMKNNTVCMYMYSLFLSSRRPIWYAIDCTCSLVWSFLLETVFCEGFYWNVWFQKISIPPTQGGGGDSGFQVTGMIEWS